MLDGVPLHIRSGELHYFRVPSAYWKDRLRKMKAAGLNSVSTYVEWSFHEPEERQYSFSADRDVAQFVRAAADEGLHVLLRPGPYICAERDLGGFPYWLLSKYPTIRLRTTDKDFIKETRIWMEKLFQQLSPLLFGNGGPIILVQVENEYGSYGNDVKYKEQIRDIIREHVGSNALLYTADGTYLSLITSGAVAGALTTINFGPTDDNIDSVFRPLRSIMPEGPLMDSEYYPGWLTHWSESFQRRSTDAVVKTLNDMMRNQINFNFYMFFGGTNFEFTAGANYDMHYQPDITSYDYDAPLNEAGDPTPKYYAIRNVLEQYDSGLKNVSTPTPSQKGKYGKVTLSEKLSLLSPEGRSRLGKNYNEFIGTTLPTFEKLRQRAGLMLYETVLTSNISDGLIYIKRPRDRVYVYIDGILQGIIDRMTKLFSTIFTSKSGSILSLLVETQGRINYGQYIHDYKGILSNVLCNNKILNGSWTLSGFPLEEFNLDSKSYSNNTSSGPVLYAGEIVLPDGQEPLDTFIDTSLWRKGYVWVNGHNLGRYWPTAGPQVTLYVPGVWLKSAPARNQILLLELEQPSPNLNIEFLDYPILDRK